MDSNAIESCLFALVTVTVSGRPWASTTRRRLLPSLPRPVAFGLFLAAISPQSGTTAVTSISTLARSSTSADTSTAVMAMLKLPISSRKAWPISA